MKDQNANDNSFKNELEIDEGCLEKEWVDQPLRFMKWAERSVEARHAMERQKFALDVLTAELDNQIRNDPQKFGLAKATETAIQNAITLQEDYQTAQRKHLKLRSEYDLLSQAVTAFDQRKRALENLVHLYSMNYYSTPSEPKGEVARERIQTERKRRVRQPQKGGI